MDNSSAYKSGPYPPYGSNNRPHHQHSKNAHWQWQKCLRMTHDRSKQDLCLQKCKPHVNPKNNKMQVAKLNSYFTIEALHDQHK